MSGYLISRLNKRGSLLIEALLAISILSIALTLIVNSFLSSFRASVYAKDYTLATILLENKLCELKEKGFIADGVHEEENFAQPHEKFRYHLESKNVNNDDQRGVFNEVKLSVTWPSGRRSNNITLVTYLFNLPQ